VIDSSNEANYAYAKKELLGVLIHDHLKSSFILIVLNKCDIGQKISKAKILQEIDEIRKQGQYRGDDKKVMIIEGAITKDASELKKGLDWLAISMLPI